MVSADGHCRPFDALAERNGLRQRRRRRPAEAAGRRDRRRRPDLRGHPRLRPQQRRLRQGRIHRPQSSTVRSQPSSRRWRRPGVDAGDVGYIECHGTATPLGDPIEVAALTKAFRKSTEAQGYCAIGSVKGNIGHLDAAAGVAGLIKTALMLRNRELVPSLNFEAPNPHIAFEGGPFFVNTARSAWPTLANLFAPASVPWAWAARTRMWCWKSRPSAPPP